MPSLPQCLYAEKITEPLQNPPPEEAGAVFVVWLMIVVFFLTIVFGAEGRGTPRRG